MGKEPFLHRALTQDDLRLVMIPIRRLAERLGTLGEREALSERGLAVVEWRIIFVLARDGAGHLQQIAHRASVDRRQVGRYVERLERRGLVGKRTDPTDRRRTVVEATEEGMAVYRELRPKYEALADEFRALYSDYEYGLFMQLIERAILRADMMLARKGEE
jgi:DNA-binding MarR family transcriptional regulator